MAWYGVDPFRVENNIVRKLGMKIRTQDQIMQLWREAAQPKVTIGCITFNQHEYIEQTLKGFLMQETDFPFEILIHDDASTDGTAEILRAYEARYPQLIRTICQTENQHTLGRGITGSFIFPNVRGDYVALCEGDDYWTDPLKLQKQVGALERNADCNLCVHPVRKKHGICGDDTGVLGELNGREEVSSVQFLVNWKMHNIPTASVMLRSSMLRRKELAEYFQKNSGSWLIKFVGAMDGGAVFLPDVMGVYRVGAKGSYTERVGNSYELDLKYMNLFLSALEQLDELTDKRFTPLLKTIKSYRVHASLMRKDIPEPVKQQMYQQYGCYLTELQKALFHFPWLSKLWILVLRIKGKMLKLINLR